MHDCDGMQVISAEKSGLVYIPKFREYGIRIFDGGSSFIVISYCPWCGEKLPVSLRSEWFRRIEELNLEPDSLELPIDFATDQWWKK
jgi:hypothetical protein